MMVGASATLDIVRVHPLSQDNIRHGVEPALNELGALQAEVVLHVKGLLLLRLHHDPAELGPVGRMGPVGQHGHHAGDAQPGVGRRVRGVVATLPQRVAPDSHALALADADLPGVMPAGGRQRHDGLNLGALDFQGPLQCLHASHAAAHYAGNRPDAHLPQYLRLQPDHVTDGHLGETPAVALACAGVYGGRPRRAIAATEDV
mmetsp:Transcript_109824/g.328386  ORF Transcript_109824/g.328386 Transcript_109824/m.328386 type:complete len:203 (-) Transcript_109824:364-972(-)